MGCTLIGHNARNPQCLNPLGKKSRHPPSNNHVHSRCFTSVKITAAIMAVVRLLWMTGQPALRAGGERPCTHFVIECILVYHQYTNLHRFCLATRHLLWFLCSQCSLFHLTFGLRLLGLGLGRTSVTLCLWRYLVISAFRDLGLSELGLFGGDLGLFCGDLGLFCGDLGPVLW